MRKNVNLFMERLLSSTIRVGALFRSARTPTKMICYLKIILLVNILCLIAPSLKAEVSKNVSVIVGHSLVINPWRDAGLDSGYKCLRTGIQYNSDPSALEIKEQNRTKVYNVPTQSGTEEGYYCSYKVNAIKTGDYEIICYVQANKQVGTVLNIGSSKVTYYVSVQEAPKVVSISIPSNLTLKIGSNYTFSPVIYESGASTTLTWTSSNGNVASVNSSGYVYANSVGKATISCTAANGVSASCTVTVEPIYINSISLNYSEYELEVDDRLNLVATILPENSTIKDLIWSSSNENVAIVSSSGQVIGVSEGYCNIKAESTDGSGKSSSCLLHVLKKTILVEQIILDKSTLDLEIGELSSLSATILPQTADNKSLTWNSIDPLVAVVDDNGNVSAVSEGTTNVIVSSSDGGNVTALCVVTVRNPSSSQGSVLVDGNSFTNDTESKMEYISYTRNFTNANWQALYLPFEMDYEDWKDDFVVARINDTHQWDDNDDGVIDRTELEVIKLRSGQTEAHTPYLIRAKSKGEKTITVTDATLYAAEELSYDVSSWNTLYTFTGTYTGVPGETMLGNGYYAFGGGSLHQAADATNALSPFRWYMAVTDRNGNPKELGEVKVVVFDMEDETDGITPIDNGPLGPQGRLRNEEEQELKMDNYFDLSGRCVTNPRKGIYVKNGRKVVIK